MEMNPPPQAKMKKYFRALKTGFPVEKTRLDTVEKRWLDLRWRNSSSILRWEKGGNVYRPKNHDNVSSGRCWRPSSICPSGGTRFDVPE